MWDWELLRNGSGIHRYEIIGKYGNEDFQYTHAISYGSQQDDYCIHSHAMFEIVYCIRGDVVYMAEGTRYPFEPGCLLILSPAVPHKLFICSDQPFERHILYINYAGNTSSLSAMITQCQHPVRNKRVGSTYYTSADVEPLRSDFERMSRASQSPHDRISSLIPYFAQAMLANLLLTLDRINPSRFSQSASKTTDRLMIYLNQNFTQPLTLQGIADVFSVSKDYCNRLFRQASGMTIMQYIIYSRVLYAKHLLTDGVPAAEAAQKAGFTDYSNFYRSYFKITGRKPSTDHKLSENVLEAPALLWLEGD